MSYNGWRNYDTWNVALWIENDEGLYNRAVAFMKRFSAYDTPKLTPKPCAYYAFIFAMGLDETETPDGVAYMSDELDTVALHFMMWDLIDKQPMSHN